MTLESFLFPTQAQLFELLLQMYNKNALFCKDNFILVKGEVPVMLIAHLDTAHEEHVKVLCKADNGNILMSPEGVGGDDRCGVYALCTTYERTDLKPWLLFTCDEEIGGKGAETFCELYAGKKLPAKLSKLKMLIEIDRKGEDDAVYYDCDNRGFETYINSKGFKTAFGSFSDISVIAPKLGVAAVNLSSGYYNAHTKAEYINRKQLHSTIHKVMQIVSDIAARPDFPRYSYIRRVYAHGAGGFKWSGRQQDSLLPYAPFALRDDYEVLLDYYSKEELENLRIQFGDDIIPKLVEALGFPPFDERDVF